MGELLFTNLSRTSYLVTRVRGCGNRASCSSLVPLIPFKLVAGLLLMLLGPVYAQGPVHLPVDPHVVHGTAIVDTVGGHMTITNSANTVLNWQDFSIGANQEVYFRQPDATSQVLNRVIGNDPSHIFGSLGSNGGVWLINPHGVLFGPNARIDVASLVTSTLDISNIDFLAGRYNFTSAGGVPGGVTNQGQINTTFGGRVLLVGGQVNNDGIIKTPGGNIVLAAGKSIELVDSGAPNVIVRVSAPENQVANLGSLVAAAGSVDLHGSIVNQSGIVRADSIGTDSTGKIVLKASESLNLTENSETRANGGTVLMTSGATTYLAGVVDVSRQQGAGGSIGLTTGTLEGAAAGTLRADGEQGGTIHVEGTGLIAFSSMLSTTGGLKGGTIAVTGDQVHLKQADVDASGGISGGTVHIGGGWQGGGDLPHARQILIGAGSAVKANGGGGALDRNAKGGEIVVWSTQSSQQYGWLQAWQGGRIEVSSRGTIQEMGTIDAGRGGLVLFDPKNLIIEAAADNEDLGTATFASNPSGDTSLNPAAVTSAMERGSDVVLQANNDISINTRVIATPGTQIGGASELVAQQVSTGSLALQAGHNINFNANVDTGDRNLTAIAGDPGANTQFRDPGTPTITINPGVVLNVGSGIATLAALGGNFINSNGDSAISITDGGRWFIYAADPAASAVGFSTYDKHYNQPFAFGVVPSYASDGNWVLYSISPTLLVAPVSQSITYGSDNPNFSPGFKGFIDGDNNPGVGDSIANWTVGGALSSSGHPVAGTHNVAYAGGLTSSLGYKFTDDTASSNELTMVSKTLVASAVGVPGKIYDGLTAASPSGSLSGVVVGSSGVSDQVNLTASFNNKNVGLGKPVTLGLSGADSGNYTLAPVSPVPTADIFPRSLTANGFAAQNKVYDATTTASVSGGSLVGLVAGDNVPILRETGTFDNKNVGIHKTVFISDVSLGGADAGNYTLSPSNISPATADITPATLIYSANPAILLAGLPVNGLSGTVNGFKPGDNLANSTTGTLVWSTPATPDSLAGIYAINGGGLTATNYIFVPNPGNATALTLQQGIGNLNNNPVAKQETLDTSMQSINTAMYGSFPVLDFVTSGFVTDMASMPVPRFGPLDLSRMTRDEMRQLIEERREFKEKLFADAIYKLEMDPNLANVQPCARLADANTGLCRVTEAQQAQHAAAAQEELRKIYPRVKLAKLPQIERKYAVLFGIDQYRDKTIPPLENTIFDAETVGKLFKDKLGYEVRVVQNPSKADVVRILNELAMEMRLHDSVVIYYAGHGFRDEKAGGYWIPSDASVSDPRTWISNTDVSRMLAQIAAKQMVMIADSCYSGRFAEQAMKPSEARPSPEDVLAKRSVIVLSSGGDEPVADEGREGHSIFAWDLMRALRDVNNWQPGGSVFEQVKRDVVKSFPQTPQYGAVPSAGHQAGGDYLFEFRQLEEVK